MSTRARITFIVREEGHRLKYSKHWDGYPYAVLGSLPAGTFTIEEAYKKYYLDSPEPQMPDRAVIMTHLSNPTFAEFDKQKLSLRSRDILIDTQAANIYGVTVTEVRRAASRNKERFPADFAFRITKDEIRSLPDELRNVLHFEKNRYLPYAFTETGFSMLATLLSSETAAKANFDMISAVSATNSIQSLMQKFLESIKDSDPKKPI